MQSASVRRESRRRAMGGASTGSIPLLPFSVAGIVGLALFYFYYVLWIRPERMRSKLRSQGIDGPPPSLIHGNILEMRKILREERKKKAQEEECGPSVTASYVSALFPYLTRWRKRYAKSCLLEHPGPIFMYSTGSMQTLHVSHPDLVKEISVCKSLDLGKPLYLQKDRGALLGKGILTSNGALWAHQRKVIATELFMDKVKVYLSPHAYIPFGSGTRTCAGQNFAMVELKVILSLLLSKFVFSVKDDCDEMEEDEGAESFGLYETIRGEGEDNDDKMEEAAAIHDRGSHVGEPTVRHVVSESDTRCKPGAADGNGNLQMYTITYFDRRRPIDGEIDRWRSIEEEKGKKKKRKRRKQKKRRSTSHRPRLRALATRWSPASRCHHRRPTGDFCPRTERRFVSPRCERDQGD
ncbi:hypothetical protein BHM03_00044941, partial [Ensete ventricosum]